ncbi:MAG: hypothetical protein SFY80_14060 [Verrucomicrobiota bacterium]|nr:hypothetical protein [Verrucomicrobiota bacterium]
MNKTTLSGLMGLMLASSLTLTAQTTHEPWGEHYPSEQLAYSEHNPAAVTDGNSNSTTGLTSRAIVTDHALANPCSISDEFEETSGTSVAEVSAGGGQSLEVAVGRGSFTAGNVEGEVNSITVPFKHRFTDRVSVKASIPLNYTIVKDVGFPPSDIDVWGGGLIVAVPYDVYIKADNVPYRWTVSPALGMTLRDSSDANVGTWMSTAAVASNFNYKINNHFILNIGNALTLNWSQRLGDDSAKITQKDQQIVVNGVQFIVPIERWVMNAFIMDTRLLQDAAVDNYQTYGLGGGYQFSKKISLRLYVYTDQGPDYQAYSVSIASAWNF